MDIQKCGLEGQLGRVKLAFMESGPSDYRLTIRPMPGWFVPPIIQLRTFLKELCRRQGYKCISVEEVTAEPEPDKRGEGAA